MELSHELEILIERWNLILGKFDLPGKINLMKIVLNKAENILAGDIYIFKKLVITKLQLLVGLVSFNITVPNQLANRPATCHHDGVSKS